MAEFKFNSNQLKCIRQVTGTIEILVPKTQELSCSWVSTLNIMMSTPGESQRGRGLVKSTLEGGEHGEK